MANLQRGNLGPDVQALQQRLNDLGADPRLVVDGVFGARTEAAVIAFQRTHNLVPDGVVGPRTRAALDLPDRDEHTAQTPIPADVETRIRQVMDMLVMSTGSRRTALRGWSEICKLSPECCRIA